MNRLLIATTNPAKLAEYRLLMRGLALDLMSLNEAGISASPEETGATFVENALIKARFYFARAAIPTLADDGGLEIDALGGEPGVKSHRWLGDGPNDDRTLIDEVIRRMREVKDPGRTARLRCALALRYRVGDRMRAPVVEAAIEGVIAREPYRSFRPGFPYRAVLFLPQRNCYLGELGDEEEARISQRRAAIEQARSFLEEIART